MLKTVITAILLVTPLVTGAYEIETDLPDEIRAQCAKNWPGDYRMQEYCIKKQTVSAVSMIKAYQQSSGERRNIVKRCLHKWRLEPIRTEYSFDYRMVSYCIDRQAEAYQRIHSSSAKAAPGTAMGD